MTTTQPNTKGETMTYTVFFDGRDDEETKVFADKDSAIEFLRHLTVAGEVRDSDGKQWAVRPSHLVR